MREPGVCGGPRWFWEEKLLEEGAAVVIEGIKVPDLARLRPGAGIGLALQGHMNLIESMKLLA